MQTIPLPVFFLQCEVSVAPQFSQLSTFSLLALRFFDPLLVGALIETSLACSFSLPFPAETLLIFASTSDVEDAQVSGGPIPPDRDATTGSVLAVTRDVGTAGAGEGAFRPLAPAAFRMDRTRSPVSASAEACASRPMSLMSSSISGVTDVNFCERAARRS